MTTNDAPAPALPEATEMTLAPCPWCGWPVREFAWGGHGWHYIECSQCLAHGPMTDVDDPEGDAREWNRVAAAAAIADARREGEAHAVVSQRAEAEIRAAGRAEMARRVRELEAGIRALRDACPGFDHEGDPGIAAGYYIPTGPLHRLLGVLAGSTNPETVEDDDAK